MPIPGILKALFAIQRSRNPRLLIYLVQLAVFVSAGIGAFLLRFDFSVPDEEVLHLAMGLLIWVLVKSIVFHLAGLDRGWWRFLSIHDLWQISSANVLATALSTAALYSYDRSFPRSIYLLDLLLSFLGTSGIRMAARMVYETALGGTPPPSTGLTLIYGAGTGGVTLLREIRSNSSLAYNVIGFIDDDPVKQGLRLHGVRVLGTGTSLPDVVTQTGATVVLIAIPSATGVQMGQILKRCSEAGVSFKTIPGLAELMQGDSLAARVRDVSVEDLLGRSPANLDQRLVGTRIEGETILVTGAAGSIGSELCRQIARFRPRAIVGFEIGESALFNVNHEMRVTFPGIEFHPEIGSVQSEARLEDLFRKHRPSMVFHAAAYKHVPLMERHAFEAIENNVIGTANLALAARSHGVRDFVLISTDKAVRPTSVMGATKRVAELITRSLQNEVTRFTAVRFGNVLGSAGSVVPLFKQQIAAGGPVTVTHPDMRRYFMTIPEAAQLVLQASCMGQGGEVFLLEMGEPIRIADLARNLILLSGFEPEKEIQIQFVGVRPGEKLFEELSLIEEGTIPTEHEKIRVLVGVRPLESKIMEHLNNLTGYCSNRDLRGLLQELQRVVPDYTPGAWLVAQSEQMSDSSHPKQIAKSV